MRPASKAKKPGLALVISMGKGGMSKPSKPYEHDEPDGDEADDVGTMDGELPEEFQAAADELADTLKLDETERDGFASALFAAIQSAK